MLRRITRQIFRRRLLVLSLVVFTFAASPSVLRADVPRALPPGKLPADRRLEPLKDLDGYFPFTPSKSPEEWKQRTEFVRRQMLVALGLWPMPTKTPVNAVVHGRVERDDFTVDRVYLESYPGNFVTGSLYRPKNKSGKLPGVLCPHGHWNNGRFVDMGPEQIKKDIVAGAERFDPSGRYPLQARCIQLARMGCVVFHYDMVGYADSQQIPSAISHGFAKQRPEMDKPESWGFFGVQAELRGQSIMGLQTWNSIRALDWLSELPDVDASRIGVTGASGGGTQTFVLAALDPRVTVAFPAVMVSTAMQGGCTCENASLLRIDTGNIEFAALCAPRPIGMTGADDWTKEIATKGLPELKQHYAMLGVADKVAAFPFLHFPHNYNSVSRHAMYQWMNKHLGLGVQGLAIEQDFKPLSTAEMTVWDDKHPKPAGGEEYERSLTKVIASDSEKQIAVLSPTDAGSLERYRQVVGGGVAGIIGRSLPAADAIHYERVGKNDRGDYWEFTALLDNKEHGEEVPVLFYLPKQWNRRVVIWLNEAGKTKLITPDGKPGADVKRLVSAGYAVAGVDLLYQGEFLADGKPMTSNRKVGNPREFAGYTYGYNHPLFTQRVHDVLTVISFCKNWQEDNPERVELIALDGTAPIAAAALAQANGAVDAAAIDTSGFRFTQLKSIYDVSFVPSMTKFGDLPGLLSLAAPMRLWLAGEGSTAPAQVVATYRASSAEKSVTSYSGPADQKTAAALDWLVRQ